MMRLIKFTLIFLSLVAYLIIGGLTRILLFAAKPHTRTKALNRITYYLMHVFTTCGGINISVAGDKSLLKEGGLFVISSHVSYMDAIILGTLLPGSFTTKSDAKKMPFFGQVVSVGDSIFIDRKRKSDIVHYVNIMADRLKNGINVFNFPEGHATDGTEILSFFPSFFNAPLRTKAPILPITIDYEKLDGSEEFQKDEIYWYDNKISLFRHLWNLLKYRRIDVTVTIHEKITPNGHNADSKGRRLISDLCLKRLSGYKNLPINDNHPLIQRNTDANINTQRSVV